MSERSNKNLLDGLPIDVKNIAYAIMFYEGVGNLFPWNAFITASSYYGQRFCGTMFEGNFENYFSLTFTLSQTIGLALSVIFQNKISLRNKVVWPLVSYSLIFLITTILVTQTVPATLLFWLTLISMCLCGLCGAILSGGLFGLAAMFPPSYTGALMNGQGVAGLFVAIASILTTLGAKPIDTCSDDTAGDDDSCPQGINYSALIYFSISTCILVSCVGGFFFLQKLEFTKFYIARSQNTYTAVEGSDMNSPLMDHEDTESDRIGDRDDFHIKREVVINGEGAGDDQASRKTLTFEQIKNIFMAIRSPAISVWFIFTVSIGCFPALIVLLQSSNQCKNNDRFSNDLFVPFFFVMFNLFDLLGRLTAGSTTLIFTAKNIWMASLSRVIFFPLFLLCNIADSKLPVWFENDAFPIIFMIIFAYSNGYIASACMMLGPSAVSVKDAAVAGTIMVFSLTSGLFSGACMSFLVAYISQGSLA